MSKFISNNKEIRVYVRTLIKTGEAQLYQGSKHPYLRINGCRIIIPSRPSCTRAYYNFRRDIRRLTGKK